MSETFVSYEDYLAAEETSELKHEWLDGMIYAMSRGTPEHARLSANVTSALRTAFKGVCSVYSSDAMLFVRETSLSTYADASVTCGSVETHRVVKNGRALGEAITNPAVIVEVLSEATQDYDRGEKFGHYIVAARALRGGSSRIAVGEFRPRVGAGVRPRRTRKRAISAIG